MSKFHKTYSVKGFSLIEVLVATIVIATGLIAIVSIFPFSMKVNKGAEKASLASAYARAKMEQLLITSYDDLATGTIEARARISNDPTDPAYTLERQTVVALVDSNLNNSGTDVGIKKITVTVFWKNRQNADSSIVLNSLLSSR